MLAVSAGFDEGVVAGGVEVVGLLVVAAVDAVDAVDEVLTFDGSTAPITVPP